jgi:hypothetical protein
MPFSPRKPLPDEAAIGEELKQIGMARVAAKNQEFMAVGIRVYEYFCEEWQGEYNANTVRDAIEAEPDFIPPTNYRAWGALGNAAHARGLVTELEFVQAQHASGHRSRIPKYVGRLDPRWNPEPKKIYDERVMEQRRKLSRKRRSI